MRRTPNCRQSNFLFNVSQLVHFPTWDGSNCFQRYSWFLPNRRPFLRPPEFKVSYRNESVDHLGPLSHPHIVVAAPNRYFFLQLIQILFVVSLGVLVRFPRNRRKNPVSTLLFQFLNLSSILAFVHVFILLIHHFFHYWAFHFQTFLRNSPFCFFFLYLLS